MVTRLSSIIKIETAHSNKLFMNYFLGLNLFFILISIIQYFLGNQLYMAHIQYNLLVLIIFILPLRVAVSKIDKPTFFKFIIFGIYIFYIISIIFIDYKIDVFNLVILFGLMVYPLIYMSDKAFMFSTITAVLLMVLTSYFWNMYEQKNSMDFTALYRTSITAIVFLGCYFGLTRIIKVIKYLLEDNVNPFIDKLTGAYNKHYLEEKLSNIPFRGNLELSIISIDIDNMKSINDKYGFGSGDLILQDFINTVKALTRESDSICRTEGDRFAIIVQHPKDFLAKVLANRIKSKLENSKISVISKDNKPDEISISASFGVATLKEGENSDVLLQRAEKSLQLAKKNGKNRVEISS